LFNNVIIIIIIIIITIIIIVVVVVVIIIIIVILALVCSAARSPLQTLAKNGILSAPVLIAPDLEDLGELREEQPRPQLLGWVDVNDIVRAFVKCANLTTSMLSSKTIVHACICIVFQAPYCINSCVSACFPLWDVHGKTSMQTWCAKSECRRLNHKNV
jgi:hypothetical protein